MIKIAKFLIMIFYSFQENNAKEMKKVPSIKSFLNINKKNEVEIKWVIN